MTPEPLYQYEISSDLLGYQLGTGTVETKAPKPGDLTFPSIVYGTDTQFLSELLPGMTVIIHLGYTASVTPPDGNPGTDFPVTVDHIVSDTEFWAVEDFGSSPYHEAQPLGPGDTFSFAGSGMRNVEFLPLIAVLNEQPAPRPIFVPYAEGFDTADGGRRGLGAASTIWHWDAITAEQRNALRAYCPGTSSVVTIRTRSFADGNYHVYQANMIWPATEEWNARGVRTNFEILFRNLIPQ